jgi:hypothetical protein
MRCSMTSTFTGFSVSCIDIDPVEIDVLACASRVALRPSQPFGVPGGKWPMPINGCDLREVSFPESLRLRASVTDQPRFGRWQVTHAVFPDADTRGSQKSMRPSLTSAGLSIGRGGGRLYSVFIVAVPESGTCCAEVETTAPAELSIAMHSGRHALAALLPIRLILTNEPGKNSNSALSEIDAARALMWVATAQVANISAVAARFPCTEHRTAGVESPVSARSCRWQHRPSPAEDAPEQPSMLYR